MKFSAVAIALSLAASAQAFAPSASVALRLTLSNDARQVTSSELNLFGMNTLKAKKFNAPAAAQDTVSEGEVRGESRISKPRARCVIDDAEHFQSNFRRLD